MQTSDDAVRVCVAHVLVGKDNIVLGGHVVGNVVVHDQAQQPVQQRQVHLFVDALQLRLHQDHALAAGGLPHVSQVVDALAPLVAQQRGRLAVRRLDPAPVTRKKKMISQK